MERKNKKENLSQEIFKKIDEAIPSQWDLNDLVDIIDSNTPFFEDAESDYIDIVDEIINIASSEFKPTGEDDIEKVQKLCGIAIILSLTSGFSNKTEGMYKAVVLALHLGIDILFDYDLIDKYCLKMIPIAKKKKASNALIVLFGDLGISLARSQKFLKSLKYLDKAINLSVEKKDFTSAARYSSEKGRSYSELGELYSSAKTLRTALAYAKKSKDKELETHIRINLSKLPEWAKNDN